MPRELLPMSLSELSRQVGVDPFTLVRLLVASEGLPSGRFAFEEADADQLRAFARLEDPVWSEDDGLELRERLQVALQVLLERAEAGEDPLPLLALTRGLATEDGRLLRDAVLVLVDEGVLQGVVSPIGHLLAVPPGQETLVRRIADGATETPGLSAFFEELSGS